MTSQDFAIGTVTDASAHSSLVTSVFASGATVDALLGTSAAIVTGRGGGNAVASIPREATVSVNDPVVAPSLSSRQIGVVGHVDSNPASAEQIVYIQLPFNLSSLRYVYIIPKQ